MKIDAERKAGDLLKGMAQRGERETGGKPKRSHDATVLVDLGLNKTQSSRWQRESAVRKAQGYALRAEIKMGELLAATERAKGGQPHQKKPTGNRAPPVEPTLAELGITNRESAQAATASVPAAQERRGDAARRSDTLQHETGPDRGCRARIFCRVARG